MRHSLVVKHIAIAPDASLHAGLPVTDDHDLSTPCKLP